LLARVSKPFSYKKQTVPRGTQLPQRDADSGDAARRQRTAVPRVVSTVLACAVAVWAGLLLTVNPLTSSLFGADSATVPMADFGSFWASGQAATQGLNPYAVYPLTLDASLGPGTGAAVNLNPPISLPLFEMLSRLDPVTARRWWLIGTLLAYAATVGLLMRSCPRFRGPLAIAWALAFTPFVETLLLGQVYVFVAFLATLAWLGLQQRRLILAGALIGFVVAFKPMFVVWPLFLLIGGYRRAGVVGLIAAIASGLIPAARYGPGSYAQWLEAIRADAVNPQVANASLAAMLVRLGMAPTLALGVGAVLVVGIGAWVWLRRPSIAATSDVALLGALIGSPLAWVGYGVFLLPVFARNWSSAVAVVAAAAMLCVPRLVLQGWADGSTLLSATIGSTYCVACLLLLAHELQRDDNS
jgi:hypothetical protein